MEINELLEKDFHKIPKTLLFEYSNLQGLAEYFARDFANVLYELSGGTLKKEETSASQKEAQPAPLTKENVQVSVRKFRTNYESLKKTAVKKEPGVEDIAIIGIQGVFPE